MTIQVIGGGAVGLLLASCLCERFGEVEIVVRRVQQATDIHKNGVVKYSIDGKRASFAVKSSTEVRQQPQFIVVATKYHELSSIYPVLREVSPDVPLLFVQNGLAHFKEALALPQRTILFGSAQFGAQRLSDTEVAHRGIGVLKLALARGEKEQVDWLSLLESSSFPVEWIEDAEMMLFEKALLNCFVNPLTTILQVKNGVLIQDDAAFGLLQALYEELMVTFPYMEKRFPFEDVKALCERTAQNTSSMLSDHLANRKTEADTIVGAVLQKGLLLGKPMPILQTLYQLLQALDHQKSGG